MTKAVCGVKGSADELHVKLNASFAERAVRYLSGVKGVVNAVTLKHHAVAADVKAKIEVALKRSAESDAQHISVELHGGTATLTGNVHTFTARDEAALAAWTAPGSGWSPITFWSPRTSARVDLRPVHSNFLHFPVSPVD